MNLSPTVMRFAQPVTLTRADAGAYVDGRHVPATSATQTILAMVQPMSGRERELLPEGVRAKEAVLVHTATELRPGGDGKRADRVTYAGAVYEVHRVDFWGALAGYFRAVAVRV